MKKLLIVLATAVFLVPSIGLLSIGLLFNTAAYCVPSNSLAVGPIPDSLTATTRSGQTITLGRQQLMHAATIIRVGGQVEGVGRAGVVIALMAALTESSLQMLANISAYPDSPNYPHDGNGSDHDSLGLFQMRPAEGWGTVAELMVPAYQARAFFGGPIGPNFASPPGLLDIPDWQQMDPGAAAQAVEVSAYPDRYQNYQPVAEAILSALTRLAPSGGGANDPWADVPETSRVVFPLPSSTWVRTSGYGYRVHPITGERKLHSGTDYAAAGGTSILAVADGIVTHAGHSGTYGGLIVIEHTVGEQGVASAYAHMWERGIHVIAGDRVVAGQHIGDVGSSGYSTGPHLHFEIRPGGTDAAAIDAEPWLAEHHAEGIDAAMTAAPGCAPGADGPPPAAFTRPDPDALVDDPTSGGYITARMAYVMIQARTAFPESSWACWSPRPGTASEHPLGRACDVTFGNRIGQHPTDAQLHAGWRVTNWLKTHAGTLGVQYLIWQGRIWSLARDADGWRPYSGGGMHDPANVTGGHYDHLHITVNAGW